MLRPARARGAIFVVIFPLDRHALALQDGVCGAYSPPRFRILRDRPGGEQRGPAPMRRGNRPHARLLPVLRFVVTCFQVVRPLPRYPAFPCREMRAGSFAVRGQFWGLP